MTSSSKVEVLASQLLKATELDEFVAHDIGIGSKSLSSLIHSISHNLIPIFLVQVDDIKFKSVLACQPLANLYILLGGAVPLCVLVWTYLYIEKVRVDALFLEKMNRYRTIYTT